MREKINNSLWISIVVLVVIDWLFVGAVFSHGYIERRRGRDEMKVWEDTYWHSHILSLDAKPNGQVHYLLDGTHMEYVVVDGVYVYLIRPGVVCDHAWAGTCQDISEALKLQSIAGIGKLKISREVSKNGKP